MKWLKRCLSVVFVLLIAACQKEIPLTIEEQLNQAITVFDDDTNQYLININLSTDVNISGQDISNEESVSSKIQISPYYYEMESDGKKYVSYEKNGELYDATIDVEHPYHGLYFYDEMKSSDQNGLIDLESFDLVDIGDLEITMENNRYIIHATFSDLLSEDDQALFESLFELIGVDETVYLNTPIEVYYEFTDQQLTMGINFDMTVLDQSMSLSMDVELIKQSFTPIDFSNRSIYYPYSVDLINPETYEIGQTIYNAGTSIYGYNQYYSVYLEPGDYSFIYEDGDVIQVQASLTDQGFNHYKDIKYLYVVSMEDNIFLHTYEITTAGYYGIMIYSQLPYAISLQPLVGDDNQISIDQSQSYHYSVSGDNEVLQFDLNCPSGVSTVTISSNQTGNVYIYQYGALYEYTLADDIILFLNALDSLTIYAVMDDITGTINFTTN